MLTADARRSLAGHGREPPAHLSDHARHGDRRRRRGADDGHRPGRAVRRSTSPSPPWAATCSSSSPARRLPAACAIGSGAAPTLTRGRCRGHRRTCRGCRRWRRFTPAAPNWFTAPTTGAPRLWHHAGLSRGARLGAGQRLPVHRLRRAFGHPRRPARPDGGEEPVRRRRPGRQDHPHRARVPSSSSACWPPRGRAWTGAIRTTPC